MELMKNGLGNSAIARIAKALNLVLDDFDQTLFIKQALANIEALELKERVVHIIAVLHQHLPDNFLTTLNILEQLPAHWDPGDADDPLRSFAAWPIIDYISTYGLNYPEQSLASLKQLTHLFSAEFAIRAFIQQDVNLCLAHLTQWLESDNEHVRRLISEGTRPRLPWGIRLNEFIDKPELTIPLLSQLKNDKSLYVRRSVANHLNDIAKDHPKLVVDTCKKWQKDNSDDVNWLIKHATRTLVKQGHPEVFSLLGFTHKPNVSCSKLTLTAKEISLGNELTFQLTLKSHAKTKQDFVIDFAIHFVKANGSSKAKVFKLKNVSLEPLSSTKLSKSFSFKKITTRKYYSGEHKLEILLNGVPIKKQSFILTTS